jgi:hypothetical protein
MCDVKRMHPVHSADNMKKLGQMLKILSFQRYKKKATISLMGLGVIIEGLLNTLQ